MGEKKYKCDAEFKNNEKVDVLYELEWVSFSFSSVFFFLTTLEYYVLVHAITHIHPKFLYDPIKS